MMELNIQFETLIDVLSRQFNKEILSADYQAFSLQGGTVANVYLLSGIAETADGDTLPYRIVLKIQKQWERYGDPGSWRREYDLYASDLSSTFSDAFRWPTCYHAEINSEDNEFQLWLEYIDGVTGLDMTGDLYEQAALELGRYQGKLYAEQPAALKNLTNLSHADFLKNKYYHYRSWPVVYDYIRSADCDFPQHVRQMLINLDEHSDEIIARIERLPLVLCHRDFWVTNLMFTDGKVRIIDWDTCGWGYLGEDLASLIADEADIDRMVEYYQRCVPAYYRGFSEYADAPPIANHCVHELILLAFGYRLVEWYLHAEDADEKTKHARTLQQIYEMTREEVLTGGNVNHVARKANTVLRPTGYWSPSVHELLIYLEKQGFEGAPGFIGIDDSNREVLTFIPGEVPGNDYPELEPYMWSDDTLAGVARLLRRFHDATEGSALLTMGKWQLNYPDAREHEVICHNDAALYNVVFRNGAPVALIDYDMAGPGPRMWDIAYSLYTSVPLGSFSPDDSSGKTVDYQSHLHAAERRRRIHLFFEAYGISVPHDLHQWIIQRLTTLCDTLRRGAAEGNLAFQKMVEEGHVAHYEGEIRFVTDHFHDWS